VRGGEGSLRHNRCPAPPLQPRGSGMRAPPMGVFVLAPPLPPGNSHKAPRQQLFGLAGRRAIPNAAHPCPRAGRGGKTNNAAGRDWAVPARETSTSLVGRPPPGAGLLAPRRSGRAPSLFLTESSLRFVPHAAGLESGAGPVARTPAPSIAAAPSLRYPTQPHNGLPPQ